MMKGITQNLFKCLRYMALSEGSRVPGTGTENPIVLSLWSSCDVRSFASRQLGSLPSFVVYIPTRFELQSNLSLRPPDKSDHLKIADTQFQSLEFTDSNVRSAFLKMQPPQGSPQEFLPAGKKAGEACQWAGGPGALPRKILDFYLLKTRF